MKKTITWLAPALGGAAAVLLVFALYSFSTDDKKAEVADPHYQDVIRDSYRIYSLPIPDDLSFAGEAVPIDQDDVRERFDRELLVNSYWHSNTLLSIKRSSRWFPVIEPILKEEGVPDDFKYLALIESGYIQSVSPSGAVGFWQFLESTGKSYGLEINDEVDERYHIEKSTRAACAYLREARDTFGSWTAAAASYNMGIGGLKNQVDRQMSSNYWDLLLNEETSRYVCRILALREVMNRADKYGFVVRPQDLYSPLKYTTVKVDSAVTDFAVFAKERGISYKLLKLHNPWLRQNYLKNKQRKSYTLKIPVGASE